MPAGGDPFLGTVSGGATGDHDSFFTSSVAPEFKGCFSRFPDLYI